MKRWQSPVNSLPLPAPAHTAPLYPTHQGLPTHPFQSASNSHPARLFLSHGLAKAQGYSGTSLHHVTLIGMAIRSARLARAFASLLKRPLSHSQLTTFYNGGAGKTLRQQKKVNKPNQQSRMENISLFLKCYCSRYLQTEFSRQAFSASAHLLSIGLLSYLSAESAEANCSATGHIAWGSLESLYSLGPSSHLLPSLLPTKPLTPP